MINLPSYVELSQKTYDLMCRQERHGVCFNVTAATELVEWIDKEMASIKAEVEPQLPSRPLNKGEQKLWTPPKTQFKTDGTPSHWADNWFDEIGNINGAYTGIKGNISVALPCHDPIIDTLPMELKHQAALKSYFMNDLHWKPTLWNLKKDKKGKPERDSHGKVIRTSPKFHEQGRLCPNLESLGDKVDLCKPIVEWMSLRNRRSVLLNEAKGSGWLSNPRLKIDGRLSAASSGLTNTKRQKHRVVANVPKVGSLLGKEFRSLFIASEGKVFVGYDASGLEARVEAERSYKYDDGVYAAEVLDGDIHSKNAIIFGTDRDGAKSPKYAIVYGCSAPKLAGLLDCTDKQAQQYIDNYWDTNYAIGEHKKSVEQEWIGNFKKFITSVNGGKIVTRSKHSLINADFQNFGAVIMDIANMLMDEWVKEREIDANRVIFYHDEAIWECDPKDAELIAELGIKSIVEAGKFLKMSVPLDAEAKIGHSWSEVH